MFFSQSTRKPRCEKASTLVLSHDSDLRYAWVTCHQKACPACRQVWNERHIKNLRLKVSGIRRLWTATLYRSGWGAARRALKALGASYAKSCLADHLVMVLATERFPGASPFAPSDTRDLIREIVEGSLPNTRFVLTGKWKLAKRVKQKEWKKIASLPNLSVADVLEVLRAHALDPAVLGLPSGVVLECKRTPDFPVVLRELYQKARDRITHTVSPRTAPSPLPLPSRRTAHGARTGHPPRYPASVLQ